MTCTNCGKELPNNVAFCPFCGVRFEIPAEPQAVVVQTEQQPEITEPQDEPAVEVPVQEMQPQINAPVQDEAPAEGQPAQKKKKNKKSAVRIVFTVLAVVLVLGLAALNVLQYLKAEETAAELAGANDLILQMETEAGKLKNEITGLDTELTQLKGDYDALVNQAETDKTTIEDLEAQLASAETTAVGYEAQIAALEGEKADLADAAAKVSAYEEMLMEDIAAFQAEPEADAYNSHDFFCGDTNVIVVHVGETVEYTVTYADHDEDNPDAKATVQWESWYVECNSQGYEGDVLTVSITGLHPGTTRLNFSNSTNDATFEVLVVILA